MKFNLLSIVATAAAFGSSPSAFAAPSPDPYRLPTGPTPELSPVPSSHAPTPSPLPVPTNYRYAIAAKLEKEFAEMGYDPRPIDDIISLLERLHDDADAALDAMIQQEEESQSEEDDDEGSDFTGNGDELSSSSDEDSSDDMDEDEEDDDDSSTSNVESNLPSLPPPQVQNRGILGVGIGSSSDSSSAVIAIPTRNRGATNRSGSNLQGGVSLSSVSSSSTAMEVDTSSSSGGLASSGGTNSTSTAIVDLTAEDSSDDESVCPLAQREAEREARIAAERSRPPRPNVARAAAAAPAPASSATARQIDANATMAMALSEEVVEQEDTPTPLANQNSTAKVPLKTSEEEKEKEQIESNHTMANAIAESETEAAWGSLWQKPQKKKRTKKNHPKSPHQYGMQQRASNQRPPAPKPPAPKPAEKPRLLKGQQTVKKPSQPRRPRTSGLPDCSTPGCTNVVHRRGLCRRCGSGPSKECSKHGCTRTAAQGRHGLCLRCANGTRTCSVPGCTANAVAGGKKCTRHNNPCSVLGCGNYGRIRSNNGRLFCHDHAQSEATEAHAQRCRTVNRRHADRYENDPIYRTVFLIRNRLRRALRRAGTAYQGKLNLLCCTVNQLLRYFELFCCNAEDQHIDHIMPLASFDLTDPEQVRRAQHWSNLQPLSAADNLSKGSTPPVGFFWNVERGRWMWSEGSGRTNHDLPAVGAGDVTIDELFDDDDESDEFDGSGDDNDE